MRSLNSKNLKLIVLPAKSSFEKIISYDPKGIFLSNGPGDPFATGEYAVPIVKKFGGLIFTGPTHTNVNDIGLIIR